jgi:hypothetical protein
VVAGIDGEKGLTKHSLWGELAYKLGGEVGYAHIAPYDSPTTPPNAALVQRMLPDMPVLILLDELVIYMASLNQQGQGALLGFLGLLMSEIGARTQAVLVITDPAGQTAYREEAAALGRTIDEIATNEAAQRLDDVLGRKATDFDPIGNEAAQVIVRRLF